MRKMIVIFTGFSLLFSFFAAGMASATPTTHIWAPSTDVQGYGIMHVTGDFYFASERDSQGNRPDTVTNTGLTAGILPFEKLNMEMGFDHKSGLGDLDDYPMYFNAKMGIPERAFGDYFPALAVGIYDLGTKADKTDFNVWYAKAAKTFSLGDFSLGRFSAGYFNGNNELLLDGAGRQDDDGGFGAWERTLTEISDRLWVCAEYMGTESSYGGASYGLAWKFTDTVSAILGYTRYNNRSLADTVTLQFDIDFDLFSKFLKHEQ